jgi:hypothetical protein
MTADIVNLRQARKAKARLAKDTLAAANRAKFGRTKEERSRVADEAARAGKALDAHRRDDGEPT